VLELHLVSIKQSDTYSIIIMRAIIVGIVCLILGFVLGVWLPIDSDTDEDKNGLLLPISSGSGAIQSAQQVLPSVVDEGSSEESEISPERLGEVIPLGQVVVSTDLIEVLSTGEANRNLGQALLDPEGAIEQALQLSEQEQSQISTRWDETKRRIQELEVRSSKVEEMEDLSERITVPEMTQQLEAVGSQFRQSVRQALGPNRGDVFLASKQIDQVIKKSAKERTYTIVAESPKEGEWRFNMTLESPAGRRVWVGDSIPDEIRHLTDAAQIFPTIGDLPEGN
jgi:hypothetical protein